MIETHRRQVREAILDATAVVVTRHGLAAVTLSRVAEQAGVSRAVLDRHFCDTDALLRAWHDRQVTDHLAYLAGSEDEDIGDPVRRLDAVLRGYAVIVHQTHMHRTTPLGAALHHDVRIVHAQRQLHDMVRDLLAAGVATGDIRDDVPVQELTSYCLHAISTAGELSTAAAIRRRIADTLTTLRHP